MIENAKFRKEGYMEPISMIAMATLATHVISVLAPLLSKAGESLASKFGEDAYAQGKHLYQVVHDRFKKEPDKGTASKVLENFVDNPILYKDVLEKVLVPILQADPTFASELQGLTQKGPLQQMIIGSGSTARNNQVSNTQGEGKQVITAGDNSTLDGNIFKIGN
jgi:hypothetical protein